VPAAPPRCAGSRHHLVVASEAVNHKILTNQPTSLGLPRVLRVDAPLVPQVVHVPGAGGRERHQETSQGGHGGKLLPEGGNQDDGCLQVNSVIDKHDTSREVLGGKLLPDQDVRCLQVNPIDKHDKHRQSETELCLAQTEKAESRLRQRRHHQEPRAAWWEMCLGLHAALW